MRKYGLVGSLRIEFHKLSLSVHFVHSWIVERTSPRISSFPNLQMNRILKHRWRPVKGAPIGTGWPRQTPLPSGIHSNRAQPARHPVNGAIAHSSRTVTTLYRPSTPLVCCANQGMVAIFVLRPTSNRRVRWRRIPSRGGEERCVVLYHSQHLL